VIPSPLLVVSIWGFSQPEAALDIKASSYEKRGDIKWFCGSTEKKETSYLHVMHNTKTRSWTSAY